MLLHDVKSCHLSTFARDDEGYFTHYMADHSLGLLCAPGGKPSLHVVAFVAHASHFVYMCVFTF